MPKVKICGLTNYEDALFAAECGADALGFVFYKPSPRYIDPRHLAQFIAKLPPFVTKVGLFVNESSDFINKTVQMLNLDRAQIHFDVDSCFLNSLNVDAVPVIRAKSPQDLQKFPNHYKIVDSFCHSYGGSGKRLNLEWFDGLSCSKIILAGGLNAQNVSQCKPYNFYGVDVSSGVEKQKGIKDSDSVKQFINNAKKF